LEKIVDKKLLLTGGTGFVGTCITATLVHLYDLFGGKGDVTVLSRNTTPTLERLCRESRRVTHARRDLLTVTPGSFLDRDLVIHAATPSVKKDNTRWDEELSTLIVEGQQRLLNALNRNSQRFVFLSSGAVYGPHPGPDPIGESDFVGIDPMIRNSYRESKRFAEHQLSLAHDFGDIDLVVLRLFAFYGPFLPWDKHFAIGNFIRDVAMQVPIRLKSSGSAVRSYLFATDMVAWILKLAVAGDSREAYNVGSEDSVSIGELALTMDSLVGGLGLVQSENLDQEQKDFYVPSTAKANQFGLHQAISFEEGLNVTLSWGREHYKL
jgi:nucleoside-diphosphate-sugar epimerase